VAARQPSNVTVASLVFPFRTAKPGLLDVYVLWSIVTPVGGAAAYWRR
jgi:hypothetical protein